MSKSNVENIHTKSSLELINEAYDCDVAKLEKAIECQDQELVEENIKNIAPNLNVTTNGDEEEDEEDEEEEQEEDVQDVEIILIDDTDDEDSVDHNIKNGKIDSDDASFSSFDTQ
jgi:hypothetical protein